MIALTLPHSSVNLLEPSVVTPSLDPNERHEVSELHMLFSAAVSLRRIADALQPTNDSGMNSIPESLAGIMMNGRS